MAKLQQVFNPSTFDYAIDGQVAIQKLDDYGRSFDLILSIHGMPNVTGLEIYRYAREVGLEVPFFWCHYNNDVSDLAEVADPDFFHLPLPYGAGDVRKIADCISAAAQV